MVSIPETLVDEGIYHRDQNEETKPTVVSEVDGVAGNNRATIAPLDHALRFGLVARE